MKENRKKFKLLGRVSMFVFLLGSLSVPALSQNVALKTNLLYWGTATPNLGVEASLARKHTLQLFYGLHPWKSTSGRTLRHWVLQPEYRYWFCESFNGWFIGAHLMGGEFNVGNYELPFKLFPKLKDNRYEGWYAGGGVTVGYQWMISRHWNFEASLGVGYDYVKFDKFKCGVCGEKMGSDVLHYVGPTKVALSFLYIF